MVTRTTPPDEIDRINERLFREARFQIQDRDSFDLAFNDLLDVSNTSISSKQTTLRNSAFDDFVSDHPLVSKERLFTKAKGKSLKRDRSQTAKRVVGTRKEFIKETAPEVDLKGFDTARQKVKKDVIIKRVFTVAATKKGRVVRAMKTSVIVKGKKQLRFRDAKGQFVSGKVK